MLPQIEASINRRMVNSAALFNDLVGALQQRLRHGQAERLGGFQIDDQLEARRLLDRQIGGPGAPLDFFDLPRGLSERGENVRAVARPTAPVSELPQHTM